MSSSTSSSDRAIELSHRPTAYTSEPQKRPDDVQVVPLAANDLESDSHLIVADSSKSTSNDLHDMKRMGKEQKFERTFRQLSITSFVSLATASWEIGLFLISPALIDGGRAGLVWSSLWCWIGFAPIYLSMAEMASMAPIAGCQYHWVSEFAPEKYQKFLSYLTGWISTIAWQAGNAMGIFLAGSIVQTIILINNENYGFPAYQGSLLALAVLALCYVGNVYGSKILPHWQNALFVLHMLSYLAYIVPIWVNAPSASHYQVWGEFQNEGGWSNMALAVLAGQLTGISEQVGIDTTAHMAEDVQDAAKVIPRTMMTVYVLNMVLLFPAILTVCYHIPDLEAALGDSTTYPAIYVMRMSLSTGWITVILTIVALILTASSINWFAAVTRDLFAFARDNGMPYSRWLSAVHPRKHLPIHSAQLSCAIGALLSLIYIGSPVAFYAITSLSTVSLLMCYALSIGSVLWRRIYAPHTLPPARFSLGRRFGIICNVLAVAFSVWAFFWSFWPQELPVTASGFNWASPIFIAVFLFSMFYYWWRARHVYVGPVKGVEGR